MAAKTDWSDGQTVNAAALNALGTEVNTKASTTDLTTAIGGRQPEDTDLSTIAGLSPANDDVLQRKAGAWANRTIAQLKTDLGLSGTNSGDQTSVTGNAGTATKLATARTINGVAFDGSANITITDSTKEATANKGAVNGYAPLDASALVPAVNLPSYVDDVLEYANLAAFPGTGTSGKIYVALDTNKTYRWSGSAYVEISPSPGSTDSVTEGSSNKYYTDARADARVAAERTVTATLTGKTLTSPRVGTSLLDTNGNALLNVSPAASAVNNLQLSNAAASGVPQISAVGSDTNITFRLTPKGSGTVQVYASTGQTPTVQATGADTNHDLNLLSRGTGVVKANSVEVVTLSGTQTLTGKTLTNPTVTNYVEAAQTKATVTTAKTLDPTTGTVIPLQLTASTACTVTMPTAAAGKSLLVPVYQATTTGLGTITFTGVKWAGGTAPTMTATAAKMDLFSFWSDGASWYGSVAQNFTP